ncbi:expressed protein [Echinococcus multilocularis]|uniref:Expressed protein n=1 Tax=Echinococcus multilocularis TaxID=6211 RepID=A0A068Y865_ECHMU|nr:expressed protein [Echinococcus multilocularis]
MRTELSEHLLLLPHAAPSPMRDSWRLGGELKFVEGKMESQLPAVHHLSTETITRKVPQTPTPMTAPNRHKPANSFADVFSPDCHPGGAYYH